LEEHILVVNGQKLSTFAFLVALEKLQDFFSLFFAACSPKESNLGVSNLAISFCLRQLTIPLLGNQLNAIAYQ